MSIERKENVFGENTTILEFAGEQFQNVMVKVLAADIPSEKGKKVLRAGTLVNKDGKIVDGTKVTEDKAFGLVYRNVDFTYSNGNETIPVTVFGFIKESRLPKAISSTAKEKLKMIMFL